MNSDYEKRLERQVDRALKALPELPAPPTLAPRVLAILERRAAVPWYRQAWQSWPMAYQRASLALLLVCFGGFCLAAWKATQLDTIAEASQRLGGWTSPLVTAWNTIHVLWIALSYVVQHVGTGWVVGCLAAAAFGYALCVGLGTLCVRLAWAQPPSFNRQTT